MRGLVVTILLSVLAVLPLGCSSPGTVQGKRSAQTLVDDQAIELRAGGAMRTDERLYPGTNIEITCFNGRCLLTGQAPTEELREYAVDLVGEDRRIRAIENQVVIGEPASLASRGRDSWITGKVKSKLLASGDVQGTRIKVVTEDRVVFLMGLVGRAEGEAAAREASTTAGVEKVVKVFEYLD